MADISLISIDFYSYLVFINIYWYLVFINIWYLSMSDIYRCAVLMDGRRSMECFIGDLHEDGGAIVDARRRSF